ncbi:MULTISPECIES: benzoate/H(+) symporter BenE family transporter [Streptomyces]|uniref:benzoate/H(+) symporter BenE family transporter n=1 Tax=Streptomyces TaxID=1883 RepID=UPI0004C5B137|nr:MULTISPECIES: benzoate/H(+) symporter BenE family transporter [Streptomyces]RPK83195.1 Inner membrane protein YdcO [Streptomyces sp. ADI98-10]
MTTAEQGAEEGTDEAPGPDARTPDAGAQARSSPADGPPAEGPPADGQSAGGRTAGGHPAASRGADEHPADGPAEGRTPSGRRGLLADASLSAVLAGLITVVVSCSGPLLVVLAAAAAGHLTDEQTASWVWAACVGSGVTSAVLSWWTRMPVITAFSTPGAAVLVGSLGDYTYPEAVGAFLVSGLLMALVGLTGVFGKVMRRVPPGVVAAMLAGVLFSFGVDLFSALDGAPIAVLVSLATYLAVKQRSPRYAVAWALLAAVLVTGVVPGIHASSVDIGLTLPVLTAPEFTVSALVGLAVPLAVVTMASQNAPGLGVLAACGYRPNDRLLITATGLASTALAPLGGHAVNLAAITAAISTGEEAHRDPRRRYVAGLACGAFYLLAGVCGAALVGLFTALAPELIAVVAGIALLTTFSTSLAQAVADEQGRDAAVVTFLTTASGVTLGGIGSACWGLVLGLATHLALTTRRRRGGQEKAARTARETSA